VLRHLVYGVLQQPPDILFWKTFGEITPYLKYSGVVAGGTAKQKQ